MGIPLPQWLKKNSDILFNTSSLVATMLVTSVLGFAYWWVAARFYSPEAVGLASAATSAMMLLSTFFLLGQGTVLLTEIPRNKGLEGSLVSTSLLLVSITTLMASVVFAILAPAISPQLGSLGAGPQNVLLFAMGACLASITVILDQAVIALLQGGIQLWRNTLFAITKLVLLVIAARSLGQTTGISIYTTWAIGNAVSLLPIVIFLIHKKKWSLKYYIPQRKMMRSLGVASIQHHCLNLILQAPSQILPLLVTIMLSAKMNASFYTAYMIANFVFSLSFSLTTVLHATNAAQVTTLTQKMRLTVGLAFLSSLFIGTILIVGAVPILSFFGETYVNDAVGSLRILMLASIPLTIKNHYISLCRIKDKVAGAIVPIALGSLLELGLATFGAHMGGLTGLSLGWVSAMMVEALFMGPAVVTVLLGRNASNPYLDEIAASDTIMMPALNQQTGAIQLTTLGDTMTLAELDTIQMPAIESYRSRISTKLGSGSLENDRPAPNRHSPDEQEIDLVLTDHSLVDHHSKLSTLQMNNNFLRLPSKKVPVAKQQQPPEPNRTAMPDVPLAYKHEPDVENGENEYPFNEVNRENAPLRLPSKMPLARQLQYSEPNKAAIADVPTIHLQKSELERAIAEQQGFVESRQTMYTPPMMSPPVTPPYVMPPPVTPPPVMSPPVTPPSVMPPPMVQPLVMSPPVAKSPQRVLDDLEVIGETRTQDIVMDLVLCLIPIGAFLVWYVSAQGIDVRQMNDLGLISVFTPSMVGALAVITASFCFVIRHPKRSYPALLLYFGLLIFMLYGVNTVIEELPRFAVVYKHAGYTEFIMRTGTVDLKLDAYFSWPGFFSLNAFITKIAGYPNILSYAMWSPVFYNVFYFGPLYMIFTSFTNNKRIVYLSIWFFYLTNWIGQDYFSPQGLNFFLYLVIIAILVKWFKTSPETKPRPLGPFLQKIPLLARIYPWLTAPDPLTTPIQPRQRQALIVCIFVIFAFIVFSHQLTPFFTILSVCALVVFHRCRLWWVPLVMIVMTALWIVVMTRTYLAGHLSDVVGGFQLLSSFSKNVTNRVAGSPQHTFIASFRIYMSAFVWGSASISAFIRWRRGYRDATIVLLALTPFPLFIIQPYGGEMLLRSYLFSLPAMVFLMAAFFYNLPSLKEEHWRVVASVSLSLILLSGFFYTRYGNENMDYMTNNEVAGVMYLYKNAPSKSFFLGGWIGAPWQFEDYEKYSVITLADSHLFQATSKQDVNTIGQYLRSHRQKGGNVYMLFTRSQKTTFDSMSGLTPGSLDQIEQKVAASNDFKLIYRNPDVRIYQFDAPGGVVQ